MARALGSDVRRSRRRLAASLPVALARGPAFASRVGILFRRVRMRPLRMSLLLTALSVQAACVDQAKTEMEAARTRDSALTHDLVLAGYDSAVLFPAGRYFGGPMSGGRTVTESPGELAGATTSASAPSVPSAESYISPTCASPAADDQQRCLQLYLARSDVGLGRSYQALIRQLRLEAGTRIGAADPPTVKRLRNTQRNWVTYRNDECRKRTVATEGPIWAPVRARCLEEYSVLREHEIDDALAKRKPVVTRSTPAKSKATKHTRRSKTKRYKSGWG
jgi:uncharacterized protein YecT (DUF1311 family)